MTDSRKSFVFIAVIIAISMARWVYPLLQNSLKSVAEELPSDTGIFASDTERNMRMANDLAKSFPNAPVEVLDVARIIIDGKVPSEEMLRALGSEKLNQSWSRPMPDIMPSAGHTLLRQANISRNVDAAAALIAAGADIHYNSDEMPFAAIRMEEPGIRVWFSDYSRGNALLSLWISKGGDVNAANNPAYSSRSLLQSAANDNLEGIILLLKAGADPWLALPEGTNSDGSLYYGESFAEFNATADLMTLEIVFRVARLGYYRNGTPAQNKRLLAKYDQAAAQLVGSTGPKNLHRIWLMQRVLPLILEQTQQTSTPAISAILNTYIPDDIGGFFLAEDELRSPNHENQRVNNYNQTGHEFWK